MVTGWPDGPAGTWRSLWLDAPASGGQLTAVRVTAVPSLGARVYRVVRDSDGEVLANGGWTPSRDRPLRIFPASDWVGPGDRVRFDLMTWDDTVCTGLLAWT